MDFVRIQTTQNVRIEYQLAGVSERMLALIIDRAIALGYYLLLLVVFDNLASLADHGTGYIVTFIIFLIPLIFYSLIFETLLNGQTPGKKVMGIKVIQTDGSQPTFTSYFLRWLLYLVDLEFFTVGLLFIIFSKKSQRLGDMAAGTVVIKLHRNTYLGNTVFMKIEEGYKPRYPQVVMLTDNDLGLIRKSYNRAMADYNRDAMIALSDKVKGLLGITNTEDKPSVFINGVIKDYNYYLTQKAVAKQKEEAVAA